MLKVIGFDIGGTLMEYKNMPFSWLDYYENADFGQEFTIFDLNGLKRIIE